MLAGKAADNINKSYCCGRKGTRFTTISGACCPAVGVSALPAPQDATCRAEPISDALVSPFTIHHGRPSTPILGHKALFQ